MTTIADGELLGRVIKHARLEACYSQRYLAVLVDVDFTYISKIENNRLENAPSVRTVTSIAHALHMNADELLELAGKTQIQVLRARIVQLEAENAALKRKANSP